MPTLSASPAKKIIGRLRAPADKSISQRALILAATAGGTSRIQNILTAKDVLATQAALQSLGVDIQAPTPTSRIIHGNGTTGLRPPEAVLDFQNSGTGARLMLGVLATHPFVSTFTGDVSLNRRPMKRVLRPLYDFGAEALARDGAYFPLTLAGAIEPVPIRHRLEVPSAQVKSAVLLAGLNAPGETSVIEPIATRDHTERMLASFGANIRIGQDETGARDIRLTGQQDLHATDIDVPGDPSSSTFLLAAALTVPNSEVVVENVGINPQRIGVFASLKEMGADIEFLDERESNGEPVADIRARCGGEVALQGIHIEAERAASMIDEYPILAVVAAFARGETRMEGLAELRIKESDRLEAIVRLLRANGVGVEAGADSLCIEGGDGIVKGGGMVATEHDHRIAMASLVLGLGARAAVAIDDDAMIATSFPDFHGTIASLGGELRAGR